MRVQTKEWRGCDGRIPRPGFEGEEVNSKTRKLYYIRYKNRMKKKMTPGKWKIANRRCPYIWINLKPELYEDAWVIDMGLR